MAVHTPDVVIRTYMGHIIRSSTGSTLGRVVDVLADVRSRAPQWLVIRLRGPVVRHRALPLFLTLHTADGLCAPVSRRALRDSPHVSSGTSLTARQELDLLMYWTHQ